MPILQWLDRDKHVKTADAAPYRLLEADDAHSAGDPDTPNMLIQGDNLDALKALLPYYAGRVRCVYVDPPYNTRSAFEHYDDNLEHSKWLEMMLPRLIFLRDLISQDGSIWVSIDDNEGHYLKVMMDEIFGRKNFVTSFVWQKVDSPNENMSDITPDHEYVLCYARNIKLIRFKKKHDPSVLDAYPKEDEKGKFRERLLKKNGKASLRADRPSMFFPIRAPSGNMIFPIHDDGREARWSLGKDTVATMLKNDEVIWRERDRNGETVWVPYIREDAPPNPTRPHATILLDVKTSRQAKAHQREILPEQSIFDTVKPEHLIERILNICTDEADIVLDSFLGSGTTAAVAHKMGRHYIAIEMGEHAVTHCAPRLKKVIEGELGGISEAVGWKGGGGFRFYRLGAPIFDTEGRINPQIRFAHLAAHVWFSETHTALHKKPKSPFLGVHEGVAYYLLYNGILGDKRPDGGNVLTARILADLPPFEGPKVIYGEASRIGAARLKALQIVFKQTPYDVKAR